MLNHRNEDKINQVLGKGTWVAKPCLGLMSSSQADSGEPLLKLSTDKECRRRNTKDNLGGWKVSILEKRQDFGEHIHPSCPQPTRSISWLESTCDQITKGSVWTIFWSIPVFRLSAQLSFFGCCFRSAGWWGTAPPTLPRVTTRHQLLSQVQCVNLQNRQKSPEKGNNWSRPIIGQARPNFFETCPTGDHHHHFPTFFGLPSLPENRDRDTCSAWQQVCQQHKNITNTS